MAPTPNPIQDRGWLDVTLERCGEKINGLKGLGVDTDQPFKWTDEHGIALELATSGDGMTLKATPPSGQDVWTWRLPAGWAQPAGSTSEEG
jgi:hypothetical protein